ncbi:MAG: sugar transferase [Candidatus Hydrogenedentota bacterium]
MLHAEAAGCAPRALTKFLNVLFGTMGVVDPRPLTENDINHLDWDQPRYSRRWDVLPGITGLAQLYGGHGAEKSCQWIRQNLRRYTFMLDVRVVFLSFVINIVGIARVQAWLQKV